MHAATQQLHDSQFITRDLKGDTRLDLTLYEKCEAKLTIRLKFNSRGERAIFMARSDDAFEVCANASHTTNADLIKAAFQSIVEVPYVICR